MWRKAELNTALTSFKDLAWIWRLHDALRIAKDHPEIGLIIVTGSLFIAAEAREHLLEIEPELYDDLPQPYMVAYEDVGLANDRIA